MSRQLRSDPRIERAKPLQTPLFSTACLCLAAECHATADRVYQNRHRAGWYSVGHQWQRGSQLMAARSSLVLLPQNAWGVLQSTLPQLPSLVS